jgi:hypothetical protein
MATREIQQQKQRAQFFKMGTYELWFHCCQLMRLSKWGLMSFGLMVANL